MLDTGKFFQAVESQEKRRQERCKEQKPKKSSDWTLFSGKSGAGKLYDIPNSKFGMSKVKLNRNQRGWSRRMKGTK